VPIACVFVSAGRHRDFRVRNSVRVDIGEYLEPNRQTVAGKSSPGTGMSSAHSGSYYWSVRCILHSADRTRKADKFLD
jgi:hypothetical protein